MRPARSLLPALLFLLAPAAPAAPTPPAAERVNTYAEALAVAKLTGRDILVFQHGSDWNRLGQRLLADVWNRPEFARALGTNLILVTVDQPETVGNPPVAGAIDPDAEPRYESPASPVQRLRDFTDDAKPLPPSEITSIQTTNGTVFALDTNGSHVASGPNPNHETIILSLTPRTGGALLRIDFPLHDSLPGRGPGRASNGNFALSEVEVVDASGSLLRAEAAWANATEGGWGPWQTIDGNIDQVDSVWNALAHRHRQRTLLLALAEPVAAATPVVVRLHARSQWGQHVPGAIRAALISDDALRDDVQGVGQSELRNAGNVKFTWRGDDVPRIAYLDREGRPVTSEDAPRLGLTPDSLATRVLEMRAMRVKRDQLWTRAEQESGVRKAELLMESLDLLQLGSSPGHENAYKFVQDQMRAADTNDASGCLRWLEFNPDPRTMPALVNPANKLAGEKKYAEAIAALDEELKKPANRRLTTDYRQRILMAKVGIYRQWPDHDAERLQVLREIAALDPSTYLGIGATGYLAMFHKNPEPAALAYGWATNHVRSGVNNWTFRLGTTNHFDHAGRYTLRILHTGGPDSLRVKRVALEAGAKVLSMAAPDKDLLPGGNVESSLELPTWPPPGELILRLEAEATEGKANVAGRFEVDPLL